MKLLLIIGSGSFLGGITRYLISNFLQTRFFSTFPYGTMGVNVIGCFLIGFLFGCSELFDISQEVRLFLATGFLGGFTTFSAFSNETIGLLRDGQFETALFYISGSLVLGLLATYFGFSITKLF